MKVKNICMIPQHKLQLHENQYYQEPCYGLLYTAISRKVMSEKMCTRQPRKVIWDMTNTLFLTTVAVEPTFVVFQWHLQTYLRGLSCHSFKFLWRTGQTKSPTIPFGIVACTFSDNLSQNSCIQEPASTDYLQTVCNANSEAIELRQMVWKLHRLTIY